MDLLLATTQGGSNAAVDAMAGGFLAGLGIMFCGIIIVGIVVAVVLLWLIYDAAKAADPAHQKIQPAMVWLLLIPLFNIYWNFVVYPSVADSLAATARDRGKDAGDAGRSLGKAFAVIALIAFIAGIIGQFCGVLTAHTGGEGIHTFDVILGLLELAGLITWITYIVKIRGAKSKIMASGS